MPFDYHDPNTRYWPILRRGDPALKLPYTRSAQPMALRDIEDDAVDAASTMPGFISTAIVDITVRRTQPAQIEPPRPDDPFHWENTGSTGYHALQHAWKAAGSPPRPCCSRCGARWAKDIWPEIFAWMTPFGLLGKNGHVLPRRRHALGGQRPSVEVAAFEVFCQKCSFGLEFRMDQQRVTDWLIHAVFGQDSPLVDYLRFDVVALLRVEEVFPAPKPHEIENRLWNSDRSWT